MRAMRVATTAPTTTTIMLLLLLCDSHISREDISSAHINMQVSVFRYSIVEQDYTMHTSIM